MVITLCVIWIVFLIKIFERILSELNVYLLYLNLFFFFFCFFKTRWCWNSMLDFGLQLSGDACKTVTGYFIKQVNVKYNLKLK